MSDKAGGEAANLHAQLQVLAQEWKAAKGQDDREACKRIAERRLALWRQWYELLGAARREHGPELRERYLSRIGMRKECETYQLRCAAVDAGLDWATGNAALAAALGAFKKQWPRFKPVSFRRYDDPQQSLELQFTKVMSVEALLGEKHAQVGLEVRQEKARPRLYLPFRFRVGTGESQQTLTGTMQYHRDLPPEGKIPFARIVERRIGKDVKHYLQFVVRTQVETQVGHDRSPLAVLHLGWYWQPEGRRLAEVASGADPELTEQINLPPEVTDLLERSRKAAGERDSLRDECVADHLAVLDVADAPEPVRDLLAPLKKLPAQHVAPRRLAGAAIKWRKAHPEWRRDVLSALEDWRKRDRLLWQASAFLARRARGMRRKHYEAIALDLVRRFDCILIDAPSLSDAAKVKDERTGEHNDLGGRARSGRFDVALFELTSAIRKAGAKAACVVGSLSGPTASHCSHCGALGLRMQRDSARDVACDECGALTDRASNAAAFGYQVATNHELEVDRAREQAGAALQSRRERTAQMKQKRLAGRQRAREGQAAERQARRPEDVG